MSRSSRRRLRWLALLPLAVLVIFLAARDGPVSAQGSELTIDQASLRLWPEYDDPGLLVILSGVFTGTAAFPQQAAFPLPAGARGIQATVIAANGDLLSQPWQVVDGKLTYSLPQPAFQIEFYLDRPKSGNQRDINYTLETVYAIRNLAVTLQQPARAAGFSATPQPEQSFQGSDGFTYYAINRTNVAAGAKLPFNMSYAKNDEGLSVAQAKMEAAGPATSPETVAKTSTGGMPQWLPIFLIGLGIAALLGAAGYWYLRMRPVSAPAPNPARPAGKSQSRAASRAAPGGRAVFCTQCGHQLGADDRFCAKCGALRKG